MSQQSPTTAGQAETKESAFRSFIRAYGLLSGVMEPYFAKHGITGAQWGVLRTLHRAELAGESGLRLTDLGQRLLVRPPSVTGVVDRLERAGLVTRRRVPDDARAKHVAFTTKGRRMLLRVLEHHGEQIQKLMSCLDDREATILLDLTKRMGEHFEELGRENQAPARTADKA